MPLVLTLHKARDPSGQQRESRTLDQGSLSIGRGPGNAWVLQDPAQHLSKTHCIVSSAGGGYVLQDRSSNGVFLNGAKQRLDRDSEVPLADGDEFALGDFLIRVSEVPRLTSRAVAASASAAPRGQAPALPQDDPFGLDEFLAPKPPAAPLPDLIPASSPAARMDPFSAPAPAWEDPFADGADPHWPPSARPAAGPFGEPAARAAGGRAIDPFSADASPAHGAQGLATGPARPADPFGQDDDLFAGIRPAETWQGPSQPDNVDGPAQAFTPPPVTPPITAIPDLDQWDDLLGDTPPGAPPEPPAHTRPDPAHAAPPPPPPPPPSGQGDAARLIAAFLDGAGVPKLDVAGQDPEAYFRMVGALFGSMIESLREILMSRAAIKGEFGVEQTMLRPRDNNALKFSVTPEDAVAALLQPGRPGYMPPERAAQEAFDDIRIHQLAVMAGVQAALFNLLRTFDPAALEARLQKATMIETILPGARRAKLWEAFCATYKDIARDADSDFQAVFGREFARAYTEQMRPR